MAECNTQSTLRLTDWLILAFVVVVMGLLIADLSTSVTDIVNRSQDPAQVSSAPVSDS